MSPQISISELPFHQPPRWWMICLGIAILVSFTIAGWYAGHRSASLQQRRCTNELLQLTQEIAAVKLAYQGQESQLAAATAALHASGQGPSLHRQQQLQRQLLKAEADAETCKEIADRQQLALASRLSLVNMLAYPGAHLLPMRSTDPSAAASIAYALLIPSKRLVFVGSDLPELPEHHQMQIWIVRKAEPKFVSAGLLTPVRGAAVTQFADTRFLSLPDLLSIAVTNEPAGGSPSPTGEKVLTADITE